MLLEERKALTECGQTLATLCDMILGEDAEDRSDDALIRGVGRLLQVQPCGHPVQAISQNKSGTQYCRWCVDKDDQYYSGWVDCATATCEYLHDGNKCNHPQNKERRCSPYGCPRTIKNTIEMARRILHGKEEE